MLLARKLRTLRLDDHTHIVLPKANNDDYDNDNDNSNASTDNCRDVIAIIWTCSIMKPCKMCRSQLQTA